MDRTLACGAGDRGSNPLGGTKKVLGRSYRAGCVSISVLSVTRNRLYFQQMEPPTNSQPILPSHQTAPPSNMSQPQGVDPASPTSQPQRQPNLPTRTGMFTGRLNRLGYFVAIVFIFVYFLIPVILQLLLRNTGAKTVINLITILWGSVGVLLAIPVGLSVGVRRWHDLNQSGFLVLLGLIPFAGFVALIIQLFFPGTRGSNKYGEPDISSATPKKVLFGR